MKTFRISAAVVLTIVTASCAPRNPAAVAPDLRAVPRVEVATSAGPVAGILHDGLAEFKGIPFAAPPLGARRFAPPADPGGWAYLFPGVAFGAVQPQSEDVMEPASFFHQSEDCLTLNVWTPAADGKRRPVIFYVHGGGFLQGASADPLYDGAALARRGDIVFVSANYRIGALGFLYLDHFGPEFAGSGNLGLQDQIAALRWVKANIEKFGGDPGRVTLMGESAGSISASTLMAVPSAKGLFHRVIAQSGAPNITRTRDEAQKITRRFMELAGAADVGALKNLTVAKLLDAQAVLVKEAELAADKLFCPVVDGAFLPRDPFDAIAGGSAAGIQLLHGTVRDEMRYWIFYAPLLRFITPDMLLKYDLELAGRIAPKKDAIVGFYRSQNPTWSEGDVSLMLASDTVFWIPHIRLAEAQAAHAGTWMYYFTWPSKRDGGIYGAHHAIVLPFVFRNWRAPTDRDYPGPNPPAVLAAAMSDAWIAFARNGNPETGALPAWPAYDPGVRATMYFDEKCSLVNDPRREYRLLYKGLLY